MIRNQFLSASPFWFNGGVALVRIITGALMIYHGIEVFDADKMKNYAKWLTDLKFPSPLLMAYLGKGSELVCGALLLVGLFTRPAALLLAVTMLVILFGMGHGKIFTDDQHPFLFVLLALLFFFTGPGKWSLDQRFFTEKNRPS
jgi:putative oxidoreductase